MRAQRSDDRCWQRDGSLRPRRFRALALDRRADFFHGSAHVERSRVEVDVRPLQSESGLAAMTPSSAALSNACERDRRATATLMGALRARPLRCGECWLISQTWRDGCRADFLALSTASLYDDVSPLKEVARHVQIPSRLVGARHTFSVGLQFVDAQVPCCSVFDNAAIAHGRLSTIRMNGSFRTLSTSACGVSMACRHIGFHLFIARLGRHVRTS